MNTLAFDHALFPLTHIIVSVGRSPHADSMPLTCYPLAFVVLSVDPGKGAPAFFFVCPKASDINSMLRELVTLNLAAVDPMSLKKIP